ncbi:MAG TPA: FtsH protease activity modulator HflK [Rhizomicrobium sp.]|nr:FtsH protease activity modulator HflK [Rhizomicrobium sp.]
MNQSGGGQPKGPWGQGPASGGVRPPDFETLLRKFWDDVRRYIPVGGIGRRGMMAIGVVVALLWLLAGVYTVDPKEQGVVLRFGRFVEHTGPGTHYHLPWPIESAYTPNVKNVNEIDVGYKPAADKNAQSEYDDVPDESYMLTGDENIVNMHFAVYWRIKDANAFLFNVNFGNKPEDTVKAVAESAMREAVGQERLDLIMTSDREQIQLKVKRLMQQTLDFYNAGVEVTDIAMRKAEPPSQVRDAYLDVQKALADQDRMRSEAEAYANKIIPQARGEAVHIVQDAEAYRQQVIATAMGEAQRFNSVYQEYKKAPQVTRQRIYLETMSQVLAPMNKVIVDDSLKGVMPYFQLPPLPRPASGPQQQPARSPQPPVNETVVTSGDQGGGQ